MIDRITHFGTFKDPHHGIIQFIWKSYPSPQDNEADISVATEVVGAPKNG